MDENTTLTGTESGSWMDGFLGFVEGAATSYYDAWLGEQFPEQSQELNPDSAPDPAVMASNATQVGGFTIDNKTLFVGGVILAMLMLMK